MPLGLKRIQHSQQSHFITFSCYHRRPFFRDERLRDIFLQSLEQTRDRYHFLVFGYVVMPEHVHLLVSETEAEVLSKAIQALKISVARRALSLCGENMSPFWQKRYYDHNVRNHQSFVSKLRYIHRKPGDARALQGRAGLALEQLPALCDRRSWSRGDRI
jgi:putative transposase